MARPSDKYGSPLPYDPEFRGPLKRRSCTDVLCLLLFIVFLAGWAVVAIFALREGNINRLTMPVDSFGHRCGEKDLENRTNLLFFDLAECIKPESIWRGCKTSQVCLEKCPSEFWFANIYLKTSIPFNKTDVQTHIICYNDSVVPTIENTTVLKSVIEKKACASFNVPSMSVFYRCIPDLGRRINDTLNHYKEMYREVDLGIDAEILTKANEALKELNQVNQVIQDAFHDLQNTWRHIALFSVVALVVSLLYICLLRFLAGAVVWTSILALAALLATGSFYSFRNYSLLNENKIYRIVPDANTLEGKVSKVLNVKEFWLVLLVACSVALLLIILIVVFLRSRIYIATALIKEGSKAVGCTITTIFFPIIPWILQLAVMVWAGTVFLYLYSSGSDDYRIEGMGDGSTCSCEGPYQAIKDNSTCTVEEFIKYCHQAGDPDSHCFTVGCSIRGLNTTNLINGCHMYNLFGFFWGTWFVTGLSQMILAGVFATWYWTFNKRNVAFFALTQSIVRTLWYHMGTVAFGSLIIAICSFIRAMIEYAEKKLKKFDNPLTKALICCCKCFFWCLEKFLSFINRNAYIMCAMHGKNYCLSAKDAFQLLMRNLMRVVFVDKVTDFLFFLGKVLVTGVMVAISYLVFSSKLRVLDNSGRDVDLTYPLLPVAIVGVLTYIMTTMFFSVYGISVDTLFLCFLEDCERNDGSNEKPYFMSKELMKILGKKNKKSPKKRLD